MRDRIPTRVSSRRLPTARPLCRASVISATDLQRLLAFLAVQAPANGTAPRAKFDAAHLLWYAGALIVIGAMGLFSTVAFSQMGGGALVACAVAYAVAFTVAAPVAAVRAGAAVQREVTI